MKISLLLDFYGEILTERRRQVTSLYYDDDLSLSEVAEITGISRQGVRDAVNKSVAELYSLEDKLGLAARFEELKEEINSISSELSEVSEACSSLPVSRKIKRIADRLSALNI